MGLISSIFALIGLITVIIIGGIVLIGIGLSNPDIYTETTTLSNDQNNVVRDQYNTFTKDYRSMLTREINTHKTFYEGKTSSSQYLAQCESNNKAMLSLERDFLAFLEYNRIELTALGLNVDKEINNRNTHINMLIQITPV